ncbi:MAG: hypothetical protein WDO71_03030 [Bacteroidota bacterium]
MAGHRLNCWTIFSWGDLAKNSLLEYLRPLSTQPIMDYDELRTDNFEEPDPGWDIKAGAKQIKIEVKSSIPTNHESHQAIIISGI